LAYTEIETGDELLQELSRIRDHLKSTGQIPLLHLEAHGNPDGLVLASDDFVPWELFKDVLTEINIICQINLLVVISACHGEQFVRMVRPTDRSPMWGCIGPRVEIYDTELLDAFKLFYSNLLSKPDIRGALAAIDGGMPAAKKRFALWPAEYFFLVAFKWYLEVECTDERIAERAQWIADRLTLLSDGRVEIPRTVTEEIESGLRAYEHSFEKFRQTFFMTDLYPNNETRFKVRSSNLSSAPADSAAEK
jgi:hypothetical protein